MGNKRGTGATAATHKAVLRASGSWPLCQCRGAGRGARRHSLCSTCEQPYECPTTRFLKPLYLPHTELSGSGVSDRGYDVASV